MRIIFLVFQKFRENYNIFRKNLIICLFARYKGDPNDAETFLDFDTNHNGKKLMKKLIFSD